MDPQVDSHVGPDAGLGGERSGVSAFTPQSVSRLLSFTSNCRCSSQRDFRLQQ